VTLATSDLVSRGTRTNSSAVRPATVTGPLVVTSVLGASLRTMALAISCGVLWVGLTPGVPLGYGVAVAPSRCLPLSMTCVAVFFWLSQIQTWFPLRTTSDSPNVPSSATRVCFGPPYQIRIVCDPLASDCSRELPGPPPGSGGTPRSARSITVPETP
jgi:hypothetical protein